MQIERGTRFGPYEIVDLIGAGGMGQVYRARDTRLERQVAIKVVSASPADNDAAVERFQREARAIAALTHPHICALYDVGREQDTEFLVMEYLDGETLESRLARRKPSIKGALGTPRPTQAAGPSGSSGAATDIASPLPFDEVLIIGTQLSDALAAAHRARIIHRDLKPANVMLTAAGVKVLDFGLAKLVDPSDAVGVSTGQPSATMMMTDPGLVIGTLPYMAPEQLEGRNVDARTDIFALGGILYEMTAGRRAFTGESPASLIAAILEHDPEPLSAAQTVPPGFERLVRKCLAKDPDARWQSASDVTDELRWLARGAGSGSAAARAAHSTSSGTRKWAVIAGVMSLVMLGSLGTWLWTQGRATPVLARDPRHTQVTFVGDVRAAALSPDGRTVAYATGPHNGPIRILARDLAGGQAIELWRGEDVFKLQWLPDGSSLVASAMKSERERGIWLVPRLGGGPRRLADRGLHARSPDGSQIALLRQGELQIINVDGGVSRSVPLKDVRQINDFDWSASADQIALLISTDDGKSTVVSVTSEGRNQRQVYADPLRIVALCSSPVADALYAMRQRDDTHELLRIPLSATNGGDARVLLTGLPVFDIMTTTSDPCSVSADGDRLLYMRGATRSSLWQLDLRRPTADATILTPGTSTLSMPALSPDGQSLVAVQGQESAAQIVKVSRDGNDLVRLGPGMSPSWSPNGQRLAFISSRGGARRVWVGDADGRQASEIQGSTPRYEVVWLPDGRIAWDLPDNRNYRLRDLTSGREELLMQERPKGPRIYGARFSPRGDQVAIYLNLGGPERRGLWLMSWPDRTERFLASELTPMAWSANGEWIYASGRDRLLFRVSPSTGKAELLGSLPTGALEGACSIAADERAVVCPMTESSYDAWVVEHFDPEVCKSAHR